MKLHFFLILSIFFVWNEDFWAQTKQQKELQDRKKVLLEQIKEMSVLRSKQTQARKSVATQIQEINDKIQARTELIRITNQQANLLNQEINGNLRHIDALQKELKQLRKEYAAIIRQSYKNRSSKSQMLFLLSSETFTQGYKRLQYMKQYTEYRKKQSTQIQQKNDELKKINENLVWQRKEKEKILAENKIVQNQLTDEKKQQEILIASIRKKENEYEIQIRKKQAQANAIDKEIERLVRIAIAEANAKTKVEAKTTSTKTSVKKETPTIELTPEGKTISSNFEANKGKLIWPVARGYKSQGFGTYSDPVYPDVKHNNSGVTIVTAENSDARAIFDGEVSAIIAVPGGNKAVQVRHGNFISIYYNLTDVYVNKGQQVYAKSPLGKIFTDSDGKTEMKFFLYKNTTKLNPEYWIHKM
ncbi:murein hydrolase activator EnvC family protein [Capnocytophaga catalasegens]|uniref:Peptidase M23 n=1 Tax=Capnocytophaga catalasegens TaxID=1004260 RepID=A0AAV5AX49_9FLAO|nr:peptidoglycan DD-metalloendopeptidase family protein [Capnocytophaga catalasegens]GIZ15721.1 peptidase M23 [Capnocytophaga catalasegens]GJM50108.1 peptidase M23 [Capnocytophaga catalasegens]GJM53067.1 peptidase M23 [Capnocytophaga catalasegens]